MNAFAAFFGAPTAPVPSLCDTCQHAYKVPGGTVSVGGACYDQRYCGKLTIAIHTDGKQECEYHMARPIQSQ
jgi:hypothetical protein